MGNLLDDVVKLATELHAGRRQRAQFIDNLREAESERKHSATQARYEASMQRAAAGVEERAQRYELIHELKQGVHDLRGESRRKVSELSMARARQAETDRARRQQGIADMKRQSAIGRINAAMERTENAARDRADRQAGMTQVRMDLEQARHELRQQLSGVGAEIAEKSRKARQEGREIREQARRENYQRAQNRQQQLGGYVASLKADVENMRQEYAAERAFYRRALTDPDFLDSMAAHHPPPPTNRTQAAPPAPNRATVAAPTRPVVEAAMPDDMTVIQGIGPGINNKLHAGGITTFVQLASSDVEALRDVLGNIPGDLGKLITQARELVGLE